MRLCVRANIGCSAKNCVRQKFYIFLCFRQSIALALAWQICRWPAKTGVRTEEVSLMTQRCAYFSHTYTTHPRFVLCMYLLLSLLSFSLFSLITLFISLTDRRYSYLGRLLFTLALAFHCSCPLVEVCSPHKAK